MYDADNVVTIFADDAKKYLSTDLINAEGLNYSYNEFDIIGFEVI